MEDSAKTPHALPKIVVGDAAPSNYISLRDMFNEMVAAGLELFCQAPQPARDGDPPPPDPFRIIPPFATSPPDLMLLHTESVYREPAAAGAAEGRVLLGPDLMPLRATVDPGPPVVITPPPGADAAIAAFRLSSSDAANIGKMAMIHYKNLKMTAQDYQERFDAFKTIMSRYVSADTIALLEPDYRARDPRSAFRNLVQRVRRANNPGITSVIEDRAAAIDWGIQEDLTRYLQRKETLWLHLFEMGEAWTDAKKKNHLIRVLSEVTGVSGPYGSQINDLMDDDGMRYETAKDIVLRAEIRVLAHNGNNKAFRHKDQDFMASWQPFDGKKRGKAWVYDESRAAAYVDPKSYYTSAAAVSGHAMAAEAGQAPPAKAAGKAKQGGKQSSGGSKNQPGECRFCPGQRHRIWHCPNVVRCQKDCCKGWRHRKGAPCDGGAERREYEARRKGSGQSGDRSPRATAHSASVEPGALPKVPDAAPSIQPLSGPTAADYANLVTQQAMLTQQLQQLRTQVQQNRVPSRSAVLPASPHTYMVGDDNYDDFEDYSS